MFILIMSGRPYKRGPLGLKGLILAQAKREFAPLVDPRRKSPFQIVSLATARS